MKDIKIPIASHIIDNAPEDAQRYFIWSDGCISYYKLDKSNDQTYHKVLQKLGSWANSYWGIGANNWDNAIILPASIISFEKELTPDERAIRDAPKGAERYYIYPDGTVRYMKKEVYRHISAWHSNQEDAKWHAGADFYDKSEPLPIEYSTEDPPPEGWEGFAQLPVGDEPREVFIKNGKVYEEIDHWDITDASCFTPIPAKTKRDEFIEQANEDDVNYGKLYDKFFNNIKAK